MKIKVALFMVEPRSLMSIIIASVTRNPFTHTAICVNDVWYDASESRGDFNLMDEGLFDVRNYIIKEIEVTCAELEATGIIEFILGRDYDYKGVAGWALGFLGSTSRFYCFEAICYLVWRLMGDSNRYEETNKSAKDVIDLLDSLSDSDWKCNTKM